MLPWDVSDEEAIAWLCHYALGDPQLLDDVEEFDWDWRGSYLPSGAGRARYNVFRSENRQYGDSEHVGVVTAADEADAQASAEKQFECPRTCHLRVELLEEDSDGLG